MCLKCAHPRLKRPQIILKHTSRRPTWLNFDTPTWRTKALKEWLMVVHVLMILQKKKCSRESPTKGGAKNCVLAENKRNWRGTSESFHRTRRCAVRLHSSPLPPCCTWGDKSILVDRQCHGHMPRTRNSQKPEIVSRDGRLENWPITHFPPSCRRYPHPMLSNHFTFIIRKNYACLLFTLKLNLNIRLRAEIDSKFKVWRNGMRQKCHPKSSRSSEKFHEIK